MIFRSSFKWDRLVTSFWMLLGLFQCAACVQAASPLSSYMPRAEDFTLLWWANGPQSYLGAKTPPPEAVLCMQSGAIGLVIDTKTLRVLHAGKLPKKLDIQSALQMGQDAVFSLPPLSLELRIIAGERSFLCKGRPELPKDEFYFPVRFVESGHFLQHVSIEDLQFVDSRGENLEIKGRLELTLWPDRLVLAFGLDKWPSEKKFKLQIQAGQNQISIPAAEQQPAVLELFTAKNSIAPIIETSSDLSVTHNAKAGCTSIKIPALTWKNSRGTYYPEDELDRLDRWRFKVRNDTRVESVAALMFVDEHPPAITGFTPMLCDGEGFPTGIPVQISKNWHRRQDKGELLYEGPWFHGAAFVRVPPRSEREFEFRICYARYGGVPAASHSQLCLIGWGHNQFWDETAIGSFGESICYEPGRVQRRCFIDDVRPLMTLPAPEDKPYGWAGNCGGGDFLAWINEKGEYQGFHQTRTDYQAYGPCLTDVCYVEQTLGGEIDSRVNVSIARSDDYLRVFHKIHYEVRKPVKWQRLAFYQLGSDFYNATPARRVATGDAASLIEEWEPALEKDVYDRAAMPLFGECPWISIHGVERAGMKQGEAYASRGLIVRSWNAILGGKACVQPHASFYSTEWGKGNFRTTVELSPPPGLTELKTGDFVDAELELVVFPSDAQAYYGPNKMFRNALTKYADTWRLVQREASGSMQAHVDSGSLLSKNPLTLSPNWRGKVAVTLMNGVGFVPVIFTGIKNYRDFELRLDDQSLNQEVHGNDFWQTDYDEVKREWRVTCNVPRDGHGISRLELRRANNSRFGK